MIYIINIGVSEFKEDVSTDEYINLSAKNEVKIIDSLLEKFTPTIVFVDSVHLTYVDGINSGNKETIEKIFNKFSVYQNPTHFVIFIQGHGNIQGDGTNVWYSWKVDGEGDANSYFKGYEILEMIKPLLALCPVSVISNTCHFETDIVMKPYANINNVYDSILDLFAYTLSDAYTLNIDAVFPSPAVQPYPSYFSDYGYKNFLTLFAFSQKNVWVNFNETRTYSGLFVEMLMNMNFDYSPNDIFELSCILLQKYNRRLNMKFYPRLAVFYDPLKQQQATNFLNNSIQLSMPR